MTMEHVLRDFKARVNQANHLTEFLNKKKFGISFSVNKEDYFLSFDGNEVAWARRAPEQIDLHIQGEGAIMEKVIKGEQQLQHLQKQQEVVITGKFSSILRAETIFYLNQ